MPAGSYPGFAIYLTGLPSSGKTTLAHILREMFSQRGINVQLLDSDEMRSILTPNPTYSSRERDWFYEVLSFIAALLVNNGVNVIIAATAPSHIHRQAARLRVHRFAEVYVSCPIEVCRARDPKGLWKQSDAGEIKTLPGAGVPYETPESPEVSVNSGHLSAQEAAGMIFDQLKNKGFFQDF
jgi:adenylylsulfate kinase